MTTQRFIGQVIETKYLGPTNSRGSRAKATAAAGSVTIEWDNRYNPEENYAAAARLLAQNYGWTGTMAQGVLASGNHVFVFTGQE